MSHTCCAAGWRGCSSARSEAVVPGELPCWRVTGHTHVLGAVSHREAWAELFLDGAHCKVLLRKQHWSSFHPMRNGALGSPDDFWL